MRCFAISLLIALCLPCHAQCGEQPQDVLKKMRFGVKLDVQASKNIEDMVSSYLKRALRAIGDIEVTDSNPQWVLHVLASQPTTRTGSPAATVIATAITQKAVGPGFHIWKVFVRPHLWDRYVELHSESELHRGILLHTGGPAELEDTCCRMVATFDTQFLERVRQFRRKALQEAIEATKDKD